ncbi:hypothetical protein [Paenibacillus abyssi]|uniref:Uncharacterized protein n=1 Tax=Paenibacillus abyssi TaxID=1340531 RepID=A0A917LHD4_9BACL|nr:hypothetical protein [Paenibacillus abyssi]GGG23435.1 hypothetical protein GCM10010916_45040 [Paenibacillus abyssi]
MMNQTVPIKSKLTPLMLVLTAASFAALINIVAALFYVSPVWLDREQQQNELREAQHRLALVNNTLESDQVTDEMMSSLLQAVPSSKELSGILGTLALEMEEARVLFADLKEIGPDMEGTQAQPDNQLQANTFELSVIGPQSRLLQLLNELYTAKRLFAVEEWDYRYVDPGDIQRMDAEMLQRLGSGEDEDMYTMKIIFKSYTMPMLGEAELEFERNQ